MNYNLVHYGINQWAEKVDLMFHVGVVTKRVFWYQPKFALDAIRSGQYREAPAYTGNLISAKGRLIPPHGIKGCQVRMIPFDIFHKANFDRLDNTSSKGRKAEFVVRQMLLRGIISLVLDVIDVDDEELQLDGLDIIPMMAQNYQVKCDWAAGPKELGGSGNLYIQTVERNFLGAH